MECLNCIFCGQPIEPYELGYCADCEDGTPQTVDAAEVVDTMWATFDIGGEA